MPQKNLKSGQIMKILSISRNHTNLIEDKKGGIWNYKTMISYYGTFLEKWT